MNVRNVVSKKTFLASVLTFFVLLIAFIMYSLLTGLLSFGELEDKWDGVTVATSFSSGNGSYDNPFVISNAEEFMYFKQLIEGEYTSYQDLYYKLDNDIDFNEKEITPVGVILGEDEHFFRGHFDGCGYQLMNFIITPSTIGEVDYYALFSRVYDADIENLALNNYRIEVDTTNHFVVSGLIGEVFDSSEKEDKIHNVSLSNFRIDLSKVEGVEGNVSLLTGNTYSAISLQNIAFNGEVISNYAIGYILGEGTISNVYSNVYYEGEWIDSSVSSLYTLKDSIIYLDEEEVTEESLISSFHENSIYDWVYHENNLYLERIDKKILSSDSMSNKFQFSIQSAAISLHASGIDTQNHAIYINDLVSDTNYYEGLNYTEISGMNLPDGSHQGIYGSNNLVTVYVRYNSADINDSNVYGSVSVSEDIRDYYYYKKYPVVSGYVEFDLIDNPWANRPNDKGFNGWVTDYTGAVVSLDMDTYVRSVKIPVSNVSDIINITFYSSWTTATTVTGTNFNNLKNVGMTALTASGNNPINYYTNGGVAAGYFIRVTTGTENIYSATGEKLSSCNGTCYKLLQYSDGALTRGTTYYYLTTRDTNIYTVTSTNTVRSDNITVNKPVTITGMYNGTDYSNSRTLRLYNNFTASADLRIEYIRLYYNSTTTTGSSWTTNYSVVGNYRNLKIGRGIRRYNTYITASAFVGGANSDTASLEKYTTIIESGFYINGTGVGYTDARTHYVNARITLGNDYDRIDGNNSNLIVYYCYSGTWGSNLYNSASTSNSYSTPSIHTTVKSGTFGSNHADYAAGVYVGGRASGSHYSIRSATIEGGDIYNLIGGPMSDNGRAGHNDIVMNVKGGTINFIFGGAGVSNTVGNRIINVTGGLIHYSILGGSNAYVTGTNTSNPYGKIDGDTLLYIGGNVVVGDQNNSLYNVTSGNVFGAGNGREGELDVGAVNNSNIIVGPTATIHGSVFGGGNFGAVGGNLTGNTSYSGSSSSSGGDSVPLYDDNTNDHNIRYMGQNPNNYISFNGENYRIVGLFHNVQTDSGSKDLTRIIKTSSLSTRAWGDDSTSSIATNTSTETGTHTYIFNTVTDTYNYTNYYKNYYNFFVKNDGTPSTMYQYLNTNYYQGLNNTYRNYIQPVYWGMGAAADSNMTAAGFYSAERGTSYVSYSGGVNQTSNGSSKTSDLFSVGLFYPSDYGFANDDAACLSSNLSGYSTACNNDNWLGFINNNAWTMTPSISTTSVTREYQVNRTGSNRNGYTYTMNRYYHVSHQNFVLNTHAISNRDIYYTTNTNDTQNYYNTGSVYPSFYLKEDVTISGGTGTSSDPYIIGSSDITLNTLITELLYPSEQEGGYNPTEDTGYVNPGDYQAKAHIHIMGGTVDGSVYGAGNRNGSGNLNNNLMTMTQTSIDMTGGIVSGSIYGGANEEGTVYGDVYIQLVNGTVTGNVYGGGKGGFDSSTDGTYIYRNVDVIVGNNNTSSLTIGGSVYGGSAFGSVNGLSQNEEANDHYVRVTVNSGVITGSVFGGGQGDSTYEPNEYGNVYVHINGGSMTNVYGGNDSKGEPSGTDIVYLSGGTLSNAFGGGNQTGQTNTDIRLQGSSLSGNLYGGSNQSGDVTTTHVSVSSGVVTEVFGGNNLGGSVTTSYTSITGGTIRTAIYGGGNEAPTGTSNVTVTGTTVPDVYGGGKSAGLTTSNVTITSSSASNVFGGSNILGNVTTSNVHIVNSNNVGSVYGGNNAGGSTATTYVDVTNSGVTNVFGGGDNASSGTSNIHVISGTITNLYGGGNEAGVTTTNVDIDGGTITSLFGGSNTLGNVTTSNIDVSSGAITTLYGGNNLGGVTSNTNIIATGGTITTVYGGGNQASVNSTTLNLDSITSSTIFGGGNEAQVQGNVALTISNSTVNNNVFGGGNLAEVLGNVVLTTSDTTINHSIFGGGNEADVQGNVTLTISDSSIGESVYGGGNEADVLGNVILDIDDSNITECVFGGGNEGEVGGNTTVYLTDTTVIENVYAGGNGSTAIVNGNTTITIDGASVIGSDDEGALTAPDGGCVFGSGNAASTGSIGNEKVATVNLVGGEIFGNVYGGPKMAVVYGETHTNIGASAVSLQNLVEDDIVIHGTVFGGGESNASGSDNYDYTFISVTDGIEVLIDGTGYENNNHQFVINGSIFGSGNASSSAGDSNITIKNLGSTQHPNQAISIQRATNLVIDASVMELSGTTDRTNEYSDILYSFNLIDKLIIKNGTTLLLQHNANLLKELYSGVDYQGSLVKAQVDIYDNTKTVQKNVDNRIYMLPGENLNVTINQAATSFGRVSGMTFFGMYTVSNGSYQFGVYSPSLSYGDSGDAGLQIVGGSYVIGLRNANHDITKDGFYTNTIDEVTMDEVVTQYIQPSSIGSTGYRWVVGFDAINYNIELLLAKYSSLGTKELSIIDFANGDTIFNVVGFDTSELDSTIQIVDPDVIPRVGRTQAEANGTIGLAMKAETQEWMNPGTTKYLSQISNTNNKNYTGTLEYKTDSRLIAPSLMFYAYHAKNFSKEGSLGTVVVTLQVLVPKNAIEYTTHYVTITITLTARNFGDGAFYDASITYDKKYEMPATTSVNITNQSQFTAYFSIAEFFNSFASAYGTQNNYYHVLTFNHPLPLNTVITMFDYGANDNRPEYYYYRVTQADYTASEAEFQLKNQASYPLSRFIKMDSTSTNNTYDDATNNLLYFTQGTNLVDEEFIFIIDFKETTVTGEHLNNKVSFELRNNDGWSVLNVVGIRDAVMYYSTYDTSNVVLQQTITGVDSYLYYNVSDAFDYSTQVLYNETLNREPVIDTNYEYSNMGLNIFFLDHEGNELRSSLLLGTSIIFGNREYFADRDGVFRIKLANKVSNISRNGEIIVNNKLPSGSYTLRFVLFASDDGLHNSKYENSVHQDFSVVVVSGDSYIKVTTEDYTKVVSGETGLNMNGTTNNVYHVKAVSHLTHGNIRVEVLKRDIDDAETLTYTSVPFATLFQTQLAIAPGNERYLNMNNLTEINFTFVLADTLTSGTYKIVFKMYDNNQLIDEDFQYVIVKKNSE